MRLNITEDIESNEEGFVDIPLDINIEEIEVICAAIVSRSGASLASVSRYKSLTRSLKNEMKRDGFVNRIKTCFKYLWSKDYRETSYKDAVLCNLGSVFYNEFILEAVTNAISESEGESEHAPE